MASIHKENGGINLEGMMQYADPSATSTWQADNLTPPTGQLPSERSAMEDVHTGLGIGGMLPGVGLPFDLADAGLYGAEGDYSGGLLSLISALPIAGILSGGGRIAKKGAKKIFRDTPKLEGTAGRMPKMAETMPRTSTYQFPQTKPQHRTYPDTRFQKLKDRLQSDELDLFEEMEIRDELSRLRPEYDPDVPFWLDENYLGY
jgi:hypothetical protein